MSRATWRDGSQSCAHQRLAAMEEGLPHLHDQPDRRHGASGAQGLEQGAALRHRRGAVHPQGLVDARHEEDQPDAGVLDDVAEAVDAFVAAPVGDHQGAAIGNAHEARRVAARARIGLAGRVGARQHQERRERDEPAGVIVEVVEHLGRGERADRAELRTQFGAIPDRRGNLGVCVHTILAAAVMAEAAEARPSSHSIGGQDGLRLSERPGQGQTRITTGRRNRSRSEVIVQPSTRRLAKVRSARSPTSSKLRPCAAGSSSDG